MTKNSRGNYLFKYWSIITGIGISIFLNNPAIAFVPYVFEPNQENLEKTSIEIGKTAAKLIYFSQLKEANQLAELAVKINPNDERLWSILAEAQIKSGLLKEASFSLAKAKTLNPKNAKLWFAEGTLKLQQNKLKKAIALIEKGLSIEPKNAYAYFQLGNARIMEFNLRLALEAFERAISLESTFWEAINNKGIVLFEMGSPQKAIISWRNALYITKNPEPMLALAAALYQIKNNNQESLELAKEALSQNPNYVSSKYQKEQLWGYKLQQATKELLESPDLKYDVSRALENSN